MKPMQTTASLALASSLAVLLALGACGKTEDRTAGQQLDSAIAKTGEMASQAKEDVKQAASTTEADMKDAAARTEVAAVNAKDAVKEVVQDTSITAAVSAGLAADKDLSAIKIDVDTKNGVVTLIGPAPSANARDRATEIARNVKGVSSVDNKLVIKAG